MLVASRLSRLSLVRPSSYLAQRSLPVARFFADDNKNDETAQQHEQWVEFQKSITIDGFDTGQTTTVVDTRKRGGRKKKLSLLQDEKDDDRRFTNVGGGKFPPLRYSPEETERLLQLAHDAIPKRQPHHRATRRKKRQKRRWRLVRQIRKKYKQHMAKYQERKMIKRSEKVRAVKEVLAEAPAQVQRDREYQMMNLKSWRETMVKAALKETVETASASSS